MPDAPLADDRSASKLQLVAVAGPPLVLAAAGLLHPMQLTPLTADHWTHLHLILLPIFPLLALGPWTLASGRPRARLATALLGYIYLVFYSALDVLAGIGTGTLTADDQSAAAPALFAVGNHLSYVGVTAYLLAVIVVCVERIRSDRLAAVPGGLVMLVSAISFLTSHIYWPRGVCTMIGLALGGVLLLLARNRHGHRPALTPPGE